MPAGFEPAQVERQVETAPTAPPQPASPRLPSAAQTQVDLAEQSFTLAGVLIEGSTIYANLDFLPLYEPYLGRKVTVADLRLIADAITRRYHEDGYFLSSALLPEQTIEFGIVRMRVIEGYVDDWQITGGGRGSDPQIERALRPIIGQRPARKSDVIAALKKLTDFPDLTVKPDLRALADDSGAYRLLLDIDRKRFDGAVSIDNRGSDATGPARGILLLRAFDFASRHESYQLKLATAEQTRELGYADVSTEWMIGRQGLHLQFAGTYVTSRPGADLAPFDVRILNRRLRAGVSYPLERGIDREQQISGYVDRYQSQTDVLGARRLEDRLTSLNASYRAGWSGTRLAQSVGLSLTQGLALGDTGTRDFLIAQEVGDPQFTKLQAHYVNRWVPAGAWETTVSLDGQYAVESLPSSERYSIGGSPFGSAYDPSELTGDHGLAGRIEVARPFARGTWQVGPFAAYDIGAVWRVDDEAQPARASAASLTLGARAAWRDLTSSVELAKPLTRPVVSEGDDGKDVRLFASAGWRF